MGPGFSLASLFVLLLAVPALLGAPCIYSDSAKLTLQEMFNTYSANSASLEGGCGWSDYYLYHAGSAYSTERYWCQMSPHDPLRQPVSRDRARKICGALTCQHMTGVGSNRVSGLLDIKYTSEKLSERFQITLTAEIYGEVTENFKCKRVTFAFIDPSNGAESFVRGEHKCSRIELENGQSFVRTS